MTVDMDDSRTRVKMDDPLESLDIVMSKNADSFILLFICENAPEYTDAVKLPINSLTTILVNQITQPDLILGAFEDIGTELVSEYRLKLIGIAGTLSVASGKSVIATLAHDGNYA